LLTRVLDLLKDWALLISAVEGLCADGFPTNKTGVHELSYLALDGPEGDIGEASELPQIKSLADVTV